MVGDVDHVCDLGNHFENGHLDPLAQSDRSHAASLAASTEPEISSVAFNGHELGDTAVARDGWVDALVENLPDSFGHVAGELNVAGGDIGRGRVGIVEYEAARIIRLEKVLPVVERGPTQLVGVLCLEHHLEIAVMLHDMTGRRFVDSLKPHVVGV